MKSKNNHFILVLKYLKKQKLLLNYSYCLYNSLFSAVKYYNGNILTIMLNGRPEYLRRR